MQRRGFLKGLLAAPAIIRSPGLLMPIKPLAYGWRLDGEWWHVNNLRVADYVNVEFGPLEDASGEWLDRIATEVAIVSGVPVRYLIGGR
jgi:hypothetical protein